MVVTFKCDDESVLFNSTDTDVEFKSEATNGNIEIVNDTKAEFKNSAGTIVASIDTDSQQCLINNKSVSKISIVTENTDGNSTYTTENVINCICSRDCLNSDRTDELPSATSLVNAINNCQVGSTCYFILRNTGTNNVLTLGTSLGGVTLTDIATIAHGNTSHWLFVVTNTGTPTIVGYLINSTLVTLAQYESTRSIDVDGGTVAGDFQSAPITGFPMARTGNGSGAGDAWSLSMWVNPASAIPAGNGPLFNYNILEIGIQQLDTTGYWQFRYADGIVGVILMVLEQTWTPDRWYHILWTYAGGPTGDDTAQEAAYRAEFKIFIDGVLTSTNDTFQNGGPDGSLQDLNIISFGAILGFDFKGKIDELAIFNADVSSDVATIYNGGSTRELTTLPTPPVHWWKIEPTTDSFPDMTDSIGTITLEASAGLDYSTDVPPNEFINTYSLTFTATDQSYSAAPSAGFPLIRPGNGVGASDAWSISLWYKAPPTSVTGQIFGAQDSSFLGGISLTQLSAADNFGLHVGAVAGGSLNIQTPSSIVSANTWVHILVTYDGGVTSGPDPLSTYTARFKIYLDGVSLTLSGFKNGTGWSGSYTPNLFGVGRVFLVNGGPASGQYVDEVAVFDYDAQSFVSNIYNSGVPNDLANLSGVTAPVHWWRWTQTDIDNHPLLADHIGSYDLTASNFNIGNIVTDTP